MNNNMPNNFNNGMPNNGNNQMNNGLADTAKQDLMGGQSNIGNGPSLVQGIPNTQNNMGAMQGVGSVPSTPNVMQGSVAPTPKPVDTPAMPGQNHSGINAMTMQKEPVVKEEKKDAPEVVSIPNFASNIPEKPATPQPSVMQGPSQINNPIPNPMPNPMQIPNSSLNNNQIGINQVPNTQNQVGLNTNVNTVIPNQEVNRIGIPNTNMPKEPNAQTIPNSNIISQPNSLGQTNNQTINSFPSNSLNQINNGPNPQNVGMVPPINNNLNMMNNIPNNIGNEMNVQNDLNDSLPSVNNSTINSGISQVGTTELNSMDNEVVEMPEMPTKKFPLSVREMVLIGIALVGIVAVVIMYWPKG